jgi:hypothetical protein
VEARGAGGTYSGPMANDDIDAVGELLHEAGEVHHVYFADTGGVDDDWATFYSEWLLFRTKFSQLLGKRPVRSGLTRDLVVLDEEYVASKTSEPWPTWYARRIIQKYA